MSGSHGDENIPVENPVIQFLLIETETVLATLTIIKVQTYW